MCNVCYIYVIAIGVKYLSKKNINYQDQEKSKITSFLAVTIKNTKTILYH